MSVLQTCLSVFAVAACANDDASLEHVEKAIDEYLSVFKRTDKKSAFAALQTAFNDLRLDSQAADHIQAIINERFDLISGSKKSRDKDGENSAPLA